MSALVVSPEEVTRISKNIKKALKEEGVDLPLTKVQHIFAKGLGAKSLQSLLDRFKPLSSIESLMEPFKEQHLYLDVSGECCPTLVAIHVQEEFMKWVAELAINSYFGPSKENVDFCYDMTWIERMRSDSEYPCSSEGALQASKEDFEVDTDTDADYNYIARTDIDEVHVDKNHLWFTAAYKNTDENFSSDWLPLDQVIPGLTSEGEDLLENFEEGIDIDLGPITLRNEDDKYVLRHEGRTFSTFHAAECRMLVRLLLFLG